MPPREEGEPRHDRLPASSLGRRERRLPPENFAPMSQGSPLRCSPEGRWVSPHPGPLPDTCEICPHPQTHTPPRRFFPFPAAFGGQVSVPRGAAAAAAASPPGYPPRYIYADTPRNQAPNNRILTWDNGPKDLVNRLLFLGGIFKE